MKKFEELKTYTITVPQDYNHKTCLKDFKEKHDKEFYFYNEDITDENFSKVSDKLKAGETYQVKAFGMTNNTTPEKCLAKIKEENGLLVGVQGLSLLYEQNKDKLLKGYWSISLDEKKRLFKDAGGDRRVPSVGVSIGGDFYFGLGYFEDDWNDFLVLLIFTETESSDLTPLKTKPSDLELTNKFYPINVDMDFSIKGKKKAIIKFSVEIEGLTKEEQENMMVKLKGHKNS